MLNQGLLLYKSLAKPTHWNPLAIFGLVALLFSLTGLPEASAQFADPSKFGGGFGGGDFSGSGFNPGGFSSNGLSSNGLSSNGLSDKNPSAWTAKFYSTNQNGVGVLEVEATMAESWHVYSVTQPKGGPRRTSITVNGPDSVSLASDFAPDYEPDRSESPVYKGVTIEEHSESVLWTAKIRMPAGFQDDIKLEVVGLACKSGDGRCIPVEEEMIASYAGAYANSGPAPVQASVSPPTGPPAGGSGPPIPGSAGSGASDFAAMASSDGPAAPPAATSGFRDNDYHVRWMAKMDPAAAKPGDIVRLQITAIPDESFHVYKEATEVADASTIFVVTRKSGLKVGAPTTDSPIRTEIYSPNLPPVHSYSGKVTWSIPIQIPADADPGLKRIEGQVAYLACDEESCRAPMGLKFTANVSVGDSGAKPSPVFFESTNFADVLTLVGKRDWVDSDPTDALAAAAGFAQTFADVEEQPSGDEEEQEIAGTSSFSFVLLSALIGGFILNFMPCVLPVIGLKVMSFVGQGGGDRKRIFALNLAYVGGICAVFAMLAFLAIAFSFSWGQQFQYFSVRLGVTIGLFAFALSYFNVWEIPVPGMAAGKTSQDLQSKEGYTGAFSKGIFTTLLATPCSGPLLGGVFGATLGMTSPQIALVFAMLALGMSSPYLAIGIQPGLVKFLPKPGPWMETFKQLMAFLFLAAVAYFFYQFADENKFPVFVTLMGVWFGCWIIGQVPNWGSIQKRLMAWVSGVGIATAIGLMAFTALKTPPVLQWVDYNERSLANYQAEGKTVMVDFSAKWCVNCLVNLETAIDTEATRKMVDKNDVVTMYADWTNSNPEITAKLEELNSNSIPVLAIYPAGKPNQPIVLRDLLSQNTVLEALKEAGPSQSSKRVAMLEK